MPCLPGASAANLRRAGWARRACWAVALVVLGGLEPAVAAGGGAEGLQRAIREARGRLSALEGRLAEARASYLDVPTQRAGVAVSLSRMALDTAGLLLATEPGQQEARVWVGRGERYLREAAMCLVPSRGTEVRGMLIDASSLPRTEAGVVGLVAQLGRAHFNLLVPEVLRRGYAIYGSGLTERDPEFQGRPDLLRVLIREAHRHGMEVHPWIWTLRVRSPGYGNPVLGRLPGLAARADGKEPRFLSAAHPDAREYVYALVEELADRYDVDGLLLDYIRYDEEVPEDDVSRTRFSLAYRARHGTLPPAVIPPGSPLHDEWQLWREQQVHLTVRELAQQLRSRHPRFPIAAAVFRGEGYARRRKLQHWRHWADNAWIDWPAPMLYTARRDELSRWLGWETDRHTRSHMIVPILGVHRFTSPDNLVEQWQQLQAEQVPGGMVFALGHFDLAQLDDLRAGPFREPATLPHRNLIRATRKTLAQAAWYLGQVHAQADFETAASADMLRRELSAVMVHLPLGETPYRQNGALLMRLASLEALAEAAPMPAGVRRELRHRLRYAAALVKANQFRLDRTRYVPPSRPPQAAAQARATLAGG
ncbi:MAG: family 10 glycosylhydrolase [Candidatus Sericytochromatia bacterium]|nr:family 10 glycosylhydrolase [Candidatus Sericytochromatia bacterium]